MRNILLAGTAGLLFAIGAAGVANAANPNVPTYSPYTIMAVPGSVPEVSRTSKPVAEAMRMYEGRAAYVDDQRGQATFSPLPWNW